MAAYIPATCAVLAVFLCAAAGVTQRSLFGTPFEDTLHGFFFRSYPLFLFVIVYGLARILVAAAAERGPGMPVRIVATALAVALFFVACFYPTFGGYVLRPGFAAGAMGFLRGQSGTAALALGTGASAAVFALVLGLCTALARARLPTGRRVAVRGLAGALALWAGALILQAPERFGLALHGDFPLRPLGSDQALATAALVALAALPHTLLAPPRRA